MFDYIKETYKVPAQCGREIVFEKNRKGVIAKAMGQYIGVVFYDDPKKRVMPLHPTWEVEYLDSIKPVKTSRSAERYADFLSSGTDLKFGDWLKKKCYKNTEIFF